MSMSLRGDLKSAARKQPRGADRKRRRQFEQKSFSMGHDRNFRWDKALALAEAIEDEELVRKLALRK